jgi:hypothetical protein
MRQLSSPRPFSRRGSQPVPDLSRPAGRNAHRGDRPDREKLSAWLQEKQENPEITGTIAYVGNGGPRFFLSLSPVDPDPFVGFLIVNTETNEEGARTRRAHRQYLE